MAPYCVLPGFVLLIYHLEVSFVIVFRATSIRDCHQLTSNDPHYSRRKEISNLRLRKPKSSHTITQFFLFLRLRNQYSYSLRAGGSGFRIPLGGEISRTLPNQPWGPNSLLYNGYGLSFPGVRRPRRGVNHPPHLAPRLKKE